MRTLRSSRWLAAMLPVLLAACDMDLTDPNSPNEGPIISTPAGLKQVGVGLQAEWGNELVDPIYVVGLVTDEVGAIPQAFDSYKNVDAGLEIDNNLGPSTEPWAGLYDIVQIANVLLDNVPQVTTLQPGTASGLIALAKFYKAMAFGHLLQIYERIPVAVGLDQLNPEFLTRAAAYDHVLDLLEEARQQLITTPPSTEFSTEVIAPGFNLENSINALIARYALEAGDLALALAAAQRVPVGSLSEHRFSASDPNPVWVMWYNSGNAYRMKAEDQFRTSAQPGDGRVAYWVTEAAIAGAHVPLDEVARYDTREESFPVYLPDEMKLIQAEVYARQNNLAAALLLLNQVRTQCTSAVVEPLACLPPLTLLDVPTQAAMLDAILLEREYELYLQGTRWSDLRRFGEPMKYEFLMVSRSECDSNQNAPDAVCAVTTVP